MKIYLAYRSAYIPNSRFLKEFEEESILAWFQKYWNLFAKKEVKPIGEDKEYDRFIEILGINIYSFPFFTNDGEVLKMPNSFEELKKTIEVHVFCSKVVGDENCLQILTDDDEIELAWFLFTDEYKKENWNKVNLWFYPQIPIESGENGEQLDITKEILPKGNKDGSTYFISCPVYDGANLRDLEGGYKIEAIRLPDLLSYLRKNKLSCATNEVPNYGFDEFRLLQYISKELGSANLEKVLSVYGKLPLEEIYSLHKFENINFTNLNLDELIELLGIKTEKRPDPQINVSNHFCEICIQDCGFYFYLILFDDLWVEKNQELATSILQFGKDWKI